MLASCLLLLIIKQECVRAGVMVALKKPTMTKPRRRKISPPTWEALCAFVEQEFTEFKVEDYRLFTDDQEEVSQETWEEFLGIKRSIALQVKTILLNGAAGIHSPMIALRNPQFKKSVSDPAQQCYPMITVSVIEIAVKDKVGRHEGEG